MITQHKVWKRPAGIFPSLPSGMDGVLKKHFDKFMEKGELPPELCENQTCKGMKLFNNKDLLKIWRSNFKGIQWTDKEGNILRGAGKSYIAKLFIARNIAKGVKVMVIDPQGEYRDLVNKFGGQIVDLSRNSDTIINPLDLRDHDYAEKRLSLMDLMGIMLGELSEPQKSFIDKAITMANIKRDGE